MKPLASPSAGRETARLDSRRLRADQPDVANHCLLEAKPGDASALEILRGLRGGEGRAATAHEGSPQVDGAGSQPGLLPIMRGWFLVCVGQVRTGEVGKSAQRYQCGSDRIYQRQLYRSARLSCNRRNSDNVTSPHWQCPYSSPWTSLEKVIRCCGDDRMRRIMRSWMSGKVSCRKSSSSSSALSSSQTISIPANQPMLACSRSLSAR